MRFNIILQTAIALASVNALNINNPLQHILGFSPPRNSDLLDRVSKLYGGDLSKLDADILQSWKEMEDTVSRSKIAAAIDGFVDVTTTKAKPNFEKVFRNIGTWDYVSKEKYQDYELRVKKNNPESLGIDTVDQYAGYLDITSEDKHFFYWFFESRNDPANDPVILWLNGGPGCSSFTGLFFELGPSGLSNESVPIYNPYSWNSNASVIFLEQPVGVGYSYSNSQKVASSVAAAKDVYVFLELFYQKFPQFLGNDFHIAGESYGGHYLPAIASEIINHADKTFDLTSILIGNGITDSLIQYKYYQPMACGEGGFPQVISDEECEDLEEIYPRCARLIQTCYDNQNAFACIPAYLYCESKIMGPYSRTGLNMYDIRKKCVGGGLCYEEMEYIDTYMNSPEVMSALGAEVDSYSSCDDAVFQQFMLSGDEPKPFQQFVAELLDKDIPVLIYAGDKDYICNWLGNHAWTDLLEWKGHEEFESQSLKPWYSLGNDKHVGDVKNFGNFTFLRVFDAGHMVPFDQPESSLDMVNRWIAGDRSFGY